ncbi:MAG TPA: hypothetical protein VMU09_11895 [Acidimicrobiales bacterium]|nr:hypothetical protein [Acidimicrobiales bacterium]
MGEEVRRRNAGRRRVVPAGRRRRLGCALALGEVLALAVLVAHFDAPAQYAPAVAASKLSAAVHPHHVTPVVPTTTVPPTTTTTAPPPAPAPAPVHPAPAPAPAPAPVAAPVRVVSTPADPAANIAPSPNFLGSCAANSYDDSQGCVGATVQAIDNARAREGVGPMNLPSNWYSLSVNQQTFVMTDLERTARGMAPLSEMASNLEGAAQQGASANQDPSPPAGYPFSQWGSNWAGEMGNPLEALYYWMYDDGPGSSNIECTASNTSGCWGHRHNVLMSMACHPCVMGVGYDAHAYNGTPSLTELMVDTSGAPAADFTWAQEQPYLG